MKPHKQTPPYVVFKDGEKREIKQAIKVVIPSAKKEIEVILTEDDSVVLNTKREIDGNEITQDMHLTLETAGILFQAMLLLGMTKDKNIFEIDLPEDAQFKAFNIFLEKELDQ